MAITVDIGVFARNMATSIAAMVVELARQDILVGDMDVRVLILANGCIDTTVDRARDACRATGDRIEVVDLALGGKSRTWNSFVHDLSRPGADVLLFCDADIEMPESDTLSRLVKALLARPELLALGSQPMKDIAYRPVKLSRVDRLISMAGGNIGDWQSTICGQLYAMPASAARALHLPIGLPAEDGFLRAMVLTDVLTTPENLSVIGGDDTIFHLFAAERSISGLIRHRTRIVIGSAINSATFAALAALPAPARRAELARAAGDETWTSRQIRARLPRLPHGFVPLHFLFGRAGRMLAKPRALLRPRQLFLFVAGFGFDFIVYLNAQIRMARGTGAGHW